MNRPDELSIEECHIIADYIKSLEQENKQLIDEVDYYKHEYYSECDLREKLQEENNRLSQQLVELSRVCKSKQEIIDSYLKTVEIEEVRFDMIGEVPIVIERNQEQQIIEETNKYIASLGYDIKFNRNQMIEMLEMYQNQPFYRKEVKDND